MNKNILNLILILTISIFSTSTYAEVFCENGECKEVELRDNDSGSALLDFNDDQKSKTAPVKLNDSDKLVDRKYQNQYNDLHFSDMASGLCLIDSSGNNFYRVLKVDQKKQMVTYVVESKNHEYALNVKTIFWKFDSADAFKQLQKWSCKRTPNLHDLSYVKKCVGDSQDRELLCSPPKRL